MQQKVPASPIFAPANLDNGMKEALPDNTSDDSPVFGEITYIINDARLGEFDDCPVI